LAAGSRVEFERLLSQDIHWRRVDDAECRGRAAAGEFYAQIIAQGVVVVDEVTTLDDTTGSDDISGADNQPDARLQVTVTLVPHDVAIRAHRHKLSLAIRDGLISQIVQAAAPARVEVLYFDHCPNYEELLPRLRRLLADHGINADLVTTRVDTDDDAGRLRFLGSPTVRVNGRDVDPTAGDRTEFGLQCRLYRAADGVLSGSPTDTMILDKLIDTHSTTAVDAIHTPGPGRPAPATRGRPRTRLQAAHPPGRTHPAPAHRASAQDQQPPRQRLDGGDVPVVPGLGLSEPRHRR